MESLFDDVIDDIFEGVHAEFFLALSIGSGCGFYAIGEHENGSFKRSWFWPWVFIVATVNGFFSIEGKSLVIKVRNGSGTMVLFNEINDFLRKTIFFGKFDAVFDMGFDNGDREGGFYFVMRVIFVLIFDEEFWFLKFADIMVVGTNTGEERIGSYFAGSGFAHFSECLGMKIGTFGFFAEFMKERTC